MEIFPTELTPTLKPQMVRISWSAREEGEPLSSEFLLKVTWIPGNREQVPPPGMQMLTTSEGLKVWMAGGEEQLDLWNPGFRLSLNLARREGKVWLSEPRRWQDVLRVVYFHEFLDCQGLLIHAAGLARYGKAYLFPGPSGAGKSTIVRQSPEMVVLTDEIAAVRLAENGARPQAYGTPFYGEWGKPGEMVAAPLRGLYFPVKAEKNLVIPLSSQEVLARLLPCVCTYTTWAPRLEKIFHLTVQLAERVPGYILHFRPEPDFWRVIDGP
jgi:hypothetical protein